MVFGYFFIDASLNIFKVFTEMSYYILVAFSTSITILKITVPLICTFIILFITYFFYQKLRTSDFNSSEIPKGLLFLSMFISIFLILIDNTISAFLYSKILDSHELYPIFQMSDIYPITNAIIGFLKISILVFIVIRFLNIINNQSSTLSS